MKKILLSLSIATLALTPICNIYAFTNPITKIKAKMKGKTVEEIQEEDRVAKEAKAAAKAAAKDSATRLKAMKTCASDLSNQLSKIRSTLNDAADKLYKIALSKDKTLTSAEDPSKTLLCSLILRQFAEYATFMQCGSNNVERYLNNYGKENKEAEQENYITQATNARSVLSDLRINLGILIVSFINLMKKGQSGLYNVAQVKEVITTLDSNMRGVGKKNNAGLTALFQSAINKFEDVAEKTLKDDKLVEFISYDEHVEYYRCILKDILPQLTQYIDDICQGNTNDGEDLLQTTRVALNIKHLSTVKKIKRQETDKKATKSNRQRTQAEREEIAQNKKAKRLKEEEERLKEEREEIENELIEENEEEESL